jgi:type II secretory pathway pseudopilin PulG
MRRAGGFTLVEALVLVALAALLASTVQGALASALDAFAVVRREDQVTREARFALDRMVRSVRTSDLLLLPLAERGTTAWSESVRPVLAVRMPPHLDRDRNGAPDGDGGPDGRLDEDPGADRSGDAKPGLIGIDDDGDGVVDEGASGDDDEDGAVGEDWLDGIDNDGDGTVDEDPGADQNADGAPGVLGVDDDGDSLIDEGGVWNDDEDPFTDEDGLDAWVFYLAAGTLVERIPNIAPASGLDYSEHTLAHGVSDFQVERLPRSSGDRAQLVEIRLTLLDTSGQPHSLTSRVRLGADL